MASEPRAELSDDPNGLCLNVRIKQISIAFAIAALSLAAGSKPIEAQSHRESVDVIEIEIPVQVLVDGQPVRGLTREDFTVRAAGKRRDSTPSYAVCSAATLRPHLDHRVL